jgi:hypothetical protein
MSIDLNSFVVRTDGLMAASIDKELVILNLAGDNYVGLDEIGRRIWELLETPHQVSELCRQLSREFEATPDQIVADVLPFLAELENEGMVHVAEGRSL